MDWLQVVVLAVVQGLTEFLPILYILETMLIYDSLSTKFRQCSWFSINLVLRES